MKSILRVIKIQIKGKYLFVHPFFVTTSKPSGNKSKPLKWKWMKFHTSAFAVVYAKLEYSVDNYEIL